MKPYFRLIGVTALLWGSAHAAEVTAAASAIPANATGALSSFLAANPAPADVPVKPARIETLDLTSQDADIWSRMRKGFGMADLDNDLVQTHERWYLSHPQALKNTLERGGKYLFHIVSELEKRGMPTELALLPMVESAYNPMAQSPAKAVGLWQFVPSTGKDFNLQQNWWVDERRDIVASTNAALQYLQAIYEMHGDWQLALASYNWGENAVARAIANNKAAGKPTDYNSLTMPQETRNYVPKLQALKNIIAHPDQYNLALPSIPNQPYFTTVDKPQGIDVALAARLAEMPVSEFLSFNPSYNRPVIPGSQTSPLVLPVTNAARFQANLANHDAPLVSWQTYALPRSARIEEVARQLHMAVDSLRSANGLPARARLAAGYILLIPSAAAENLQNAIKAVLPEREERAVSVKENTPRSGVTPTKTKARPVKAAKPVSHRR
ncbi:transglycosylase SLT domain-containing protein [Uliginosibacterium sp. sgz301328]|uniref:transglycosylase SLT domain-containing protein n=1 Tax=Uliginosibacterium sp. sgz301328 TaxID=3243764 RepID=UPI00359DF66F